MAGGDIRHFRCVHVDVVGAAYGVALHMTYNNFVRIHSKLHMSPAPAAGVSDWLWEIAEIAKLVEDAEAGPANCGPYRKRA